MDKLLISSVCLLFLVGVIGTVSAYPYSYYYSNSNSYYYDGNQVSKKIPALGYVLGDEGGGSYFGKQLLRDLLYKDLFHQKIKSTNTRF